MKAVNKSRPPTRYVVSTVKWRSPICAAGVAINLRPIVAMLGNKAWHIHLMTSGLCAVVGAHSSASGLK